MGVRIRHDYVLVDPLPSENDSHAFKFDADYDKYKVASRRAIVLSVPDKLRYRGREGAELRKQHLRGYRHKQKLRAANTYTLEWETEMELMEGDIVYMDYLAMPNAVDDGLVIGDKPLVKYDDIICVVRNGQIIPVNGNLLVEPIENQTGAFEVVRSQDMPVKGRVLFAGKPVTHYLKYPKQKEHDDVGVGDVVYFRKAYCTPLETPGYQTLDKPYMYMQRRVVLCVET